MTDVRPGGNRRVDRVLGPDYLDGLEQLPLQDVRAKRREAEQEEIDLSYLRRLLHGRIDILRAEQALRAGLADTTAASIVRPPGIPAAPTRNNRPFGRARHFATEPSRPDRQRRRVERLVASVDLSDVHTRTDDELERVLRTYQAEERQVSDVRARVHEVLDRCSAELTRRYADGEASVADLLDAGAEPPPPDDRGAGADPDPGGGPGRREDQA